MKIGKQELERTPEVGVLQQSETEENNKKV